MAANSIYIYMYFFPLRHESTVWQEDQLHSSEPHVKHMCFVVVLGHTTDLSNVP